MKSFLLAALAVLITFATKVVSAPTPASVDNACIGTSCVYPAGGADHSTHQPSVFKNVLINAGDHGLEAMPVKTLDQDTAQADNSMWAYPCHEGCPRGFEVINLGGGWCACRGGIRSEKRDADLAPQVMKDPGRFPFDPRVHCTNTLKGRCSNGQAGLWDRRNGRCFCGSAKTVVDLVTRKEQSVSQDAVDRDGTCADTMGVHCANGTVGVGDNDRQRCCETTSTNSTRPDGNATTSDTLTSRLLPQPLKYPTGISLADWNAIIVTLVLLDETLKSQTDFGQVCTGEKDLQAFGFQLEIFSKICQPEITMPVAQPEIAKAQKRVYSALWIDTILERHHNGGLYDFYGACEEAKVPDAVPSTLDKEYILSQLCYMGH
ncbi:hypothetical protein EPUS_01140 [Endocarpon pusillum Z07020]|uniref:Cyanovirin-N domain-containing protein n=1 Tax=Endocarpon pusillum (strain Z07020 / HMAS-L-300199) TaxID=1263415 RepID=U1GB01_ENDPU|nr:uncharacterized protein EPUS_01140 [Endocarpon pusillum Z07020]ERF69183.1 hypothetical protein EPUS_01140 [Endocarpon pusillum Z07020]